MRLHAVQCSAQSGLRLPPSPPHRPPPPPGHGGPGAILRQRVLQSNHLEVCSVCVCMCVTVCVRVRACVCGDLCSLPTRTPVSNHQPERERAGGGIWLFKQFTLNTVSGNQTPARTTHTHIHTHARTHTLHGSAARIAQPSRAARHASSSSSAFPFCPSSCLPGRAAPSSCLPPVSGAVGAAAAAAAAAGGGGCGGCGCGGPAPPGVLPATGSPTAAGGPSMNDRAAVSAAAISADLPASNK